MTSFCCHSFNSEMLISFPHFLFGCAHITASVECISIDQFLNVIRSVIRTNLCQFCVLWVKRTILDQVCVCVIQSGCNQYLLSCTHNYRSVVRVIESVVPTIIDQLCVIRSVVNILRSVVRTIIDHYRSVVRVIESVVNIIRSVVRTIFDQLWVLLGHLSVL